MRLFSFLSPFSLAAEVIDIGGAESEQVMYASQVLSLWFWRPERNQLMIMQRLSPHSAAVFEVVPLFLMLLGMATAVIGHNAATFIVLFVFALILELSVRFISFP